MSKVIKRGDRDSGDISPDTGFADTSVTKRASIISGKKFDAQADANAIREQAEQDASVILEQARAEGEEIKARSKEDGYAQGYQEGKEMGGGEFAELIAQQSLRFESIEAQAIPQLKELALTIAKKILGKELEFHPESVVEIVKAALGEKARQRREIYLRVNPEDLEAIRSAKPQLLEVLSRAKEMGIREDPDVARYGVIIETDAGTIDAQLDTQLEVFERVFKETY